MKLYHKDIGLPPGFRLPSRQVELEWSRHAMQAALDDRYGLIDSYPVLDLSYCDTIEVELTGRRVSKLVLRAEWDDDHDIVYVVIPKTPTLYFVKTVWMNHKNDTHKTLDRSRYVC